MHAQILDQLCLDFTKMTVQKLTDAQVLQLHLLQDHPDILWCLDMDR